MYFFVHDNCCQYYNENKQKRKRSIKHIKIYTQSTTSEKKFLSFNSIFKISKKTNKYQRLSARLINDCENKFGYSMWNANKKKNLNTYIKEKHLNVVAISAYLIKNLLTFVRHSLLLILFCFDCSFCVFSLLSCIYLISRKIAISDIRKFSTSRKNFLFLLFCACLHSKYNFFFKTMKRVLLKMKMRSFSNKNIQVPSHFVKVSMVLTFTIAYTIETRQDEHSMRKKRFFAVINDYTLNLSVDY
ncbi:hypothetical protein RFI_12523 [Reticulomyxa filosa]|uniref:Uncharacterized protein n=1 Tax=Reticulomyxa filosa TaxID=46433 RepID=X6NFU9_RETFI|nr:hypothetical protein RFI_12523 [Reticulomyxa filosa]|eukprot:ETO24634.1 hypothetical protein RFI_12523 [Reticulomyxa filosa]